MARQYSSSTAFLRYTLDINLTDAQVNHPLMREAEGIVAGDFLFKYKTNSASFNCVFQIMSA
jgi:hypothetical protein